MESARHGVFSVFTQWLIRPEEYGLKHQTLDAIIVESPIQSLQLIQSVLAGKKGPARDIILLNSAAAIYCADEHLSFESAIQRAKESIDSGKAADCFRQLRLLTQSFKGLT